MFEKHHAPNQTARLARDWLTGGENSSKPLHNSFKHLAALVFRGVSVEGLPTHLRGNLQLLFDLGLAPATNGC